MSEYATKKAYESYVMYLAMKRHFSTKGYDYFKYNGKVKVSADTFMTRPDVYFFKKIADIPHKENLMLANLVANPDAWIRDIVSGTGETVYKDWVKKMDSFSYTFKRELNRLDDDLDKNFKPNGDNLPEAMSAFYEKQISLETLTMLSKLLGINKYWESELKGHLIAAPLNDKLQKYSPFLSFMDTKQITEYIKEKWEI